MTAPRRILPGVTVMITRRCLDRMFLLRPSGPTNDLIRYVLAVAAARFGVRLHAACVMSNHFHLVLTDVRGSLPAFEQYLDSLLARSLNALHGRWDFFWSSGSYSCVTLVQPADVLDKVVYVLANPVKAGLVRSVAEWPGVWSRPEDVGAGPATVRRPEHFFRADGPMPPSADLEFTCPPGFESVDAYRSLLVNSLHERELEAGRALLRRGLNFIGRRKVLAQRLEARAVTEERRRRLDPAFACKDPSRRVEALQRLRAFRVAYRAAWEQFARGVRTALFPEGTYWMRIAYGVSCAPT